MTFCCPLIMLHTYLTYGVTLWENVPVQIRFLFVKIRFKILKMFMIKNHVYQFSMSFALCPCRYIYHCLINLKENYHLCVRKDFHQCPTRKNYLLDTFCALLQKQHRAFVVEVNFPAVPCSSNYIDMETFRFLQQMTTKDFRTTASFLTQNLLS